MHQLIASRFLDDHLVLRPGSARALRIPRRQFEYLAARREQVCPEWLAAAAHGTWQVDIAGRPLGGTVIVREPATPAYGRASYELNLGCNYDCEHCYLGVKKFEGLSWPDRERLLGILRDAGVLWLQLTGGEPLIDRWFPEVYRLAFAFGMMITISTNGSRLSNPAILDLLASHRPYRLTLSVYGATEASYDGLTRRRGSFARFMRGLTAAHEAGLPIRLNLIVTRHTADEIPQMRAIADSRGLPYTIFSNMSPTIYGGAESLPAQSTEYLRRRSPFTGCNAGHTFFHVDPYGNASICKVGRDPHVPLLVEGVAGLRRLGAIADRLLGRQGGCANCTLSGQCGTCMPLATLYRKANAPLMTYCRHGERT